MKLAPSHVGRKRFCSRDCQWQGHRPVTKACELCGQPYRKAKAYESRARFCSTACKNTATGRKQTEAALVSRVCPICGVVYETTQHHGGRRTCSPVCANAARGKSNELRDGRLTLVCATCEREFRVWPSRARRYCSQACSGAASSGTFRSSAIVTCARCGAVTRRSNSRIANNAQHFCSNACYHAWDRAYKGTDQMRAKMAARIACGEIGRISSTEDSVAVWLDLQGLIYERQVAVRPFYAIDFVVDSTWIEGNGCYWHGCPAHEPEPTIYQRKRITRDHQLATFCRNRGIPLLVIWEHDVRRGDFAALAPLLKHHESPTVAILADDERAPR